MDLSSAARLLLNMLSMSKAPTKISHPLKLFWHYYIHITAYILLCDEGSKRPSVFTFIGVSGKSFLTSPHLSFFIFKIDGKWCFSHHPSWYYSKKWMSLLVHLYVNCKALSKSSGFLNNYTHKIFKNKTKANERKIILPVLQWSCLKMSFVQI